MRTKVTVVLVVSVLAVSGAVAVARARSSAPRSPVTLTPAADGAVLPSPSPSALVVRQPAPLPSQSALPRPSRSPAPPAPVVQRIPVPVAEPSCRPADDLPEPTWQHVLAQRDLDVSRAYAPDDALWLDASDRSGAQRNVLLRVDLRDGSARASGDRSWWAPLAVLPGRAWVDTAGGLALVALPSGREQWLRSAEVLFPDLAAPSVLAVAATPDRGYVVAANSGSTWLAAVDPTSGSVLWSRPVAPFGVDSFGMVDGLAASADSQGVVVAMAARGRPELALSSWNPDGTELARAADVLPSSGWDNPPQVRLTEQGVDVLVHTPVAGVRDSLAHLLLRFDRTSLRLRAHVALENEGELLVSRDALWVAGVGCDAYQLIELDPASLAPLATFMVPATVDTAVAALVGGDLVVVTQDAEAGWDVTVSRYAGL